MTDTMEMGIIPHPYCYDQWLVARVLKRGRVMWEIQSLHSNGEWGETVRRKVTSFRPITSDPMVVRRKLVDASNNFTKACKDARTAMLETINEVAREHQ